MKTKPTTVLDDEIRQRLMYSDCMCVWCGHRYPAGSSTATLRAHRRICPVGPSREMRERDHALGMANKLADLVERDNGKDWNKKQILYDFDGKRRPRVSRWLRACVTQELLSQAGAR